MRTRRGACDAPFAQQKFQPDRRFADDPKARRRCCLGLETGPNRRRRLLNRTDRFACPVERLATRIERVPNLMERVLDPVELPVDRTERPAHLDECPVNLVERTADAKERPANPRGRPTDRLPSTPSPTQCYLHPATTPGRDDAP